MTSVRSAPTKPDLAHRSIAGRSGDCAALMSYARAALREAAASTDVGDRFSLSHLAALRAGAAVLADRGRPASARRRLVSVWVLLHVVAPELGEWADLFAAGAPLRAAVEAGAFNAVSARQADDQFRAASEFLTIAEAALGMLSLPVAS